MTMKTIKLLATCATMACLTFGDLHAGTLAAQANPPFVTLGAIATESARPATSMSALGGSLVSRRYAEVNFDALTAFAGSAAGSERRFAGQTLRLTLPDDVSETQLLVENAQEIIAGVITYTGRIANDDLSQFVISVEGDRILGRIHSGSRLFVLIGENGHYEFSDIETTLTIQDPASDALPAEPAVDSPKGRPREKSGSQGGNVRLLILYGSDVPARIGSVELLASNIVAQMNSSLSASGVPNSNFVSLAGLQAVGTTLPGYTGKQIPHRMAEPTPEFASLTPQMLAVGADVAMTLFSANDKVKCPDQNLDPDINTCNTGRIGGAAFNFDPARPYGAVADTYALGDLSAIHELGHILGGQHELSSGEPVSMTAEPDARGVINSNGWMTLMGGYNLSTCQFRTLNLLPACLRLTRFSNPAPAYNYSGNATGVLGTADMARALPIHHSKVADYFVDPLGVPAAPKSLSLNRNATLMTIAWPAVAGAVTNYQIEVSTGAVPAPAWSQIYSGPSTSSSYLVKLGTYYNFRVRACNGSGCGAFTQGSIKA
jgi:hypothetical protein